jgi:hypothetical protein
MTVLVRWANDLVLGVRLAVGGGRTSKTGLIRLLLGTLGVGLAVFVLLVGAAVQPAMQARGEREWAQVGLHEPVPGADPLYLVRDGTEFRGRSVSISYVQAGGPSAPRPPGVDRLPGHGESVVSPALAELLASPEGELLRPRFTERVVGTMGPAGLVKPTDLVAVVGLDEIRARAGNSAAVYGFGTGIEERKYPPQLWIILILGVVTLLVPVFIFIATSSRIASAERDRRLAALRLVGSGAQQVRRIAAAESLVSAAVGLIFGSALFLLVRASAASIELGGESFFPGDLTPPLWLVVLILLVVPALSVVTTQIALRNTIIEPLGLVRTTRPVRRRVGWRLAVIAVGVAMLLFADGGNAQDTLQMILITGGATLLLVGVPMVLPWLLERVASSFGGSGSPPFQLAARRLQLDAGTPARVVGGLAVVLAGAVALQTVLMGQMNKYDLTSAGVERTTATTFITADGKIGEQVLASLTAVPTLRTDYLVRSFVIGSGGHETGWELVSVANCEMVHQLLETSKCADGDAFVLDTGRGTAMRPGATVPVTDMSQGSAASRTVGTMRVPDQLTKAALRPGNYSNLGSIILTPGALRATPDLPMTVYGSVTVAANDSDTLERVRNAVAPFRWRVHLWLSSGRLSDDAVMYLDVRGGLLVGSLFTLLMAGVGLLVVSLDQMRERRRVIASLSATGVPTRVLAKSLLWQNAVPMLLAVTVSIAAGLGLAALIFRLMSMDFTIDWPNLALMVVTAALLIFLTTALTLPSLRGATRLTALRTE